MFESRRQPLLSREAFLRRFSRHLVIAATVGVVSLAIGMVGYHLLEHLPWIDSLLNASMILGGMGPVDQLHSSSGKLFASFYALYSGMVFLVVSAVILAPLIHRFMHQFHMETEADEEKDSSADKRS